MHPVLIEIGPISIRYYGLMYVLGFSRLLPHPIRGPSQGFAVD